MLSRRCYNSQKKENNRNSEVNSKVFSKICWKHDTPLQLLGIHYSTLSLSSAFYSNTRVSTFYHFLLSRYLGLTKRHFSSDILVPFPDLSDLYSRVQLAPSLQHFDCLIFNEPYEIFITIKRGNCRIQGNFGFSNHNFCKCFPFLWIVCCLGL